MVLPLPSAVCNMNSGATHHVLVLSIPLSLMRLEKRYYRIWSVPARKTVLGFPTTNISLIPTVCLTVQFSVGTDYLELALTPQVKDLVPKTACTSDASYREGP